MGKFIDLAWVAPSSFSLPELPALSAKRISPMAAPSLLLQNRSTQWPNLLSFDSFYLDS